MEFRKYGANELIYRVEIDSQIYKTREKAGEGITCWKRKRKL